jgi:integrating conjugative element protein (TIGR03761 family)
MIEAVHSPALPELTSHADARKSRRAPGVLRGKVWLTVQSQYASNLIRGRARTLDKAPIPGLLGFADQLRIIWAAALADDPFADWWLIKVDDALNGARSRLAQEQTALMESLQRLSSLEIRVASSRQPERVALQFTNPYAYWGAHLIARFDRVACTIMTARHVGLMTVEQANRNVQRCSAPLRRLLAVPQGYRYLNIDRETMKAGGTAAHAAIARMGELPPQVLNDTQRASLAPKLAPRTATQHVRNGRDHE